MRLNLKQNDNQLNGSFQQTPILVLNVSKKMIASIFFKYCSSANVVLEDRKRVPGDWCILICLPKVFGKVREERLRIKLVLHQDKQKWTVINYKYYENNSIFFGNNC